MFWIVLIFLAALAIIGIFLLRQQYKRIADPMKTQAVQMAMAEAGAAAVAEARSEFDVTLDYSSDSIERVDEILALLHDRHKLTEMSELDIKAHATKFGGYLGEVIKREFNADWTFAGGPVDPIRMPLVLPNGSEMFPVRWCYDQIVDGNSGNIRQKINKIADGN